MGRPDFEQEAGKDEKVQEKSLVCSSRSSRLPVICSGNAVRLSHLPDAVNVQGVLLVA